LAQERDEDQRLAMDLLAEMAVERVDFTSCFRALCDASVSPAGAEKARTLFSNSAAFDAWLERWRARLMQENTEPETRRVHMLQTNPAYIPRNHRIEAVIVAAEKGDFSLFHEMNEILSTPFVERARAELWAEPPQPAERVLQTFCGT
jgi:uncharacterized protein YdiU (UPF0061 family)